MRPGPAYQEAESAADSKARRGRLGRSAAFGPELELAIDLAHQAGRIQMERYERLEAIRAKGPRWTTSAKTS
jgi:hypothetical protein